ncbi:hypothetical protein DXG01_005577 [Tephrocybe rancida]|nr:hypothetical protein DXG01_005577 [Tephrocybe rancida]
MPRLASLMTRADSRQVESYSAPCAMPPCRRTITRQDPQRQVVRSQDPSYMQMPTALDLRWSFDVDSRLQMAHRALTPVLRKKTCYLETKSTTTMRDAENSVSYSKTKVTASKLSGHASVQCSQLADDHAAKSTRTPSPGLQTSQGGLLQPSLRPTETPAHLYMKVWLEEDTSTKSVVGSSRSAAAPKWDVSWKALCGLVDEAQAGVFMPDTLVGP